MQDTLPAVAEFPAAVVPVDQALGKDREEEEDDGRSSLISSAFSLSSSSHPPPPPPPTQPPLNAIQEEARRDEPWPEWEKELVVPGAAVARGAGEGDSSTENSPIRDGMEEEGEKGEGGGREEGEMDLDDDGSVPMEFLEELADEEPVAPPPPPRGKKLTLRCVGWVGGWMLLEPWPSIHLLFLCRPLAPL